jgi:hypothetical protein
MTKFWRDGFYRTNIYGTTSWVEGHWVDRDDWARWGNQTGPVSAISSYLSSARALGSESARYIVPNATCPICGADVFFFQNELGSRVFFDELGPPWPKHPCMDKSSVSEDYGQKTSGVSSPESRTDEMISRLALYMDVIGHDYSKEFRRKFRQGPPRFMRILRRFAIPGATLLIIHDISKEPKNILWLVKCKAVPRQLSENTLIVVEKNNFAFFDTKKMQPSSVQFTRLRSAAEFVKSLVILPKPDI